MKIFFIQLMFGLTVLFNSSLTQAQTVTTFAGSGIQGNTDGTGTAAQFSYPQIICGDTSGNLYVSGSSIWKITPQAQVTTLLSGNTFGYPSGIARDTSGNFYRTAGQNYSVQKITPQGQISTFAGSTEQGYIDGPGTTARFGNTEGLTIDTFGNLYVADVDNRSIRKITPQGLVSTLAGNGTAGYTDGIGTAARFGNPGRMTTDTAGNLYVIDSGNGERIRKITPQGQVSTLAILSNFTYALINLTIDTSGNLYITDGYNRILKMTQQGQVTTLAGNGTAGYADGIGTAAQFNTPDGITVGNDGNLYVVDTRNNRIRKITLQVLGTTETDKASKVKIYPNPAGDLVTIDTSPLKNASARLYDTSGKLIKSTPLKSGKNTLNVSELPKGNYITEILSPEGNTSQKLIKK
ncbi:T9SS type A sorting domain-containing protein [Chryseobacterium sp. PMSZPI]|uniref:T9SS type A sorting domain-containing protein n=1 Tax=Chryseobacterium sp. PMSZPI TaxID=1033900 RepID=UPI0039A38CB0